VLARAVAGIVCYVDDHLGLVVEAESLDLLQREHHVFGCVAASPGDDFGHLHSEECDIVGPGDDIEVAFPVFGLVPLAHEGQLHLAVLVLSLHHLHYLPDCIPDSVDRGLHRSSGVQHE